MQWASFGISHLKLSTLRTSGGTERGILSGFGFDLVTCPNYLAETISWIGVYLVSGLSYNMLLFAIVSVGQMMPLGKEEGEQISQGVWR